MLGWELEWGKDLAPLASVSQMQQREKGMGRLQERKDLRGQSPVFFVGRSNWNLSKCILGFPQALVGSARGPKLHSGSLCLISKLAAWSQLSRGSRSSRSTILLFFPFIFKSMSPKNWHSSSQGSIRFQTTRGPRTELQTGKKSAGLGAWCVGHPQEFQLKNNSQRHNLVHDSPKITILQKQFRPKLDSTAWDLELSCSPRLHREGMRGIWFRENLALEIANTCKTQLGLLFCLRNFIE